MNDGRRIETYLLDLSLIRDSDISLIYREGGNLESLDHPKLSISYLVPVNHRKYLLGNDLFLAYIDIKYSLFADKYLIGNGSDTILTIILHIEDSVVCADFQKAFACFYTGAEISCFRVISDIHVPDSHFLCTLMFNLSYIALSSINRRIEHALKFCNIVFSIIDDVIQSIYTLSNVGLNLPDLFPIFFNVKKRDSSNWNL